MKLFIAFFAFFALCATQAEEVKPSLIHPDFLFKSAWECYNNLILLQEEIDDSMRDVQVGVSMVLESSTSLTLEQYQNHINDAFTLYASALKEFESLKPGQCKLDSEASLDLVTTLSGNRISNCANTYDRRVRSEISAIDEALHGVEAVSNQVQLVVVKSFSGGNAFVNGEYIESRFEDIYQLVRNRWTDSKPRLQLLREKLAAAIAIQNAELLNCHNTSATWAEILFGQLMEMVNECIEFDNSRVLDVRAALRTPPSSELRQKLEDEISQIPQYEWAV